MYYNMVPIIEKSLLTFNLDMIGLQHLKVNVGVYVG